MQIASRGENPLLLAEAEDHVTGLEFTRAFYILSGRNPHLHQTHPDIVKRLKRAAGHLAGVIEMIEAGRPCLDLAQQLQAVESAITNAKRTLIHDHLDHCLESAVGSVSRDRRAPIDEFKQITKYL
jgi:uncharacterized protein